MNCCTRFLEQRLGTVSMDGCGALSPCRSAVEDIDRRAAVPAYTRLVGRRTSASCRRGAVYTSERDQMATEDALAEEIHITTDSDDEGYSMYPMIDDTM